MLGVALVMSERSTCKRLEVGCVLVNQRGHVLSTGYNGRASGLPHCAHDIGATPCKNSDAGPGLPNGCESIHAEQNALLQCRDVNTIHTAYVTHSPCLVCVKLLMNTSCVRIVYAHRYPQDGAKELWESMGREWVHAIP